MEEIEMEAVRDSKTKIEDAIEEYADADDVSHSTLKKRRRIPRDFYENVL